jgi:hypothetical protein
VLVFDQTGTLIDTRVASAFRAHCGLLVAYVEMVLRADAGR